MIGGPATIIDDLLDLHGPTFLGIYALIGVASLVVGWLLRMLASGPFDALDRRRRELPPQVAAAATSGVFGAMSTALVALLKDGHVSVHGQRSWRRGPAEVLVAGDARTRHFLVAVRDRLPADAPFTIERAIAEARPVLDQAVGDAVALGLRLSLGRRLLAILLSLVPVLAATALGVAKIAVGLERGRPVGFLMVEMMLLLGIAAIGVMFGGHTTVRGWRTLAGLRTEAMPLRVAARSHVERLDTDDIAWAVTLFGVGILQGSIWSEAALAAAPAVAPPGSRWWESGGSTSSSSGCGSSCGSSCGGGCGGGGCGGCGS